MEKLEDKMFYSAVENLSENPNREEVMKAYDVGVREVQHIGDLAHKASKIYELKGLTKECIEWRAAYVRGYQHFVKYDVHQPLDILIRNVKIMIGDQVDLVRANEFSRSLERTLNESTKE